MFKGDDAHGWLVRVHRYFRINNVRERDKLDAVVITMEDMALNFFQWWEEHDPLRTWLNSELLSYDVFTQDYFTILWVLC